MVKNPPAMQEDLGSILGPGRSPRGGHSNPLQYSCMEDCVDRGAWQTTAHGVAQSGARLKRWSSSSSVKTGRKLTVDRGRGVGGLGMLIKGFKPSLIRWIKLSVLYYIIESCSKSRVLIFSPQQDGNYVEWRMCLHGSNHFAVYTCIRWSHRTLYKYTMLYGMVCIPCVIWKYCGFDYRPPQ